MKQSELLASLAAGGVAGLSVDVSLFPLDTVKTRLQSQQGFLKVGGFRGIYSGLAPAVINSVPSGALFFCTYESVKYLLSGANPEPGLGTSLVHSTSASCGEVMACLFRVPCEVIKQRAQAAPHLTSRYVLQQTLRKEGWPGMYRGFVSTVMREVPFSMLQFPLWEHMKSEWSRYQGHGLAGWQSGVCGAVSGATAAGLTTPLDVAKTRIMLAPTGSELSRGHIFLALQIVWSERGLKGLYAGVVPRVTWIAFGGAIFLGVYDSVRSHLIS